MIRHFAFAPSVRVRVIPPLPRISGMPPRSWAGPIVPRLWRRAWTTNLSRKKWIILLKMRSAARSTRREKSLKLANFFPVLFFLFSCARNWTGKIERKHTILRSEKFQCRSPRAAERTLLPHLEYLRIQVTDTTTITICSTEYIGRVTAPRMVRGTLSTAPVLIHTILIWLLVDFGRLVRQRFVDLHNFSRQRREHVTNCLHALYRTARLWNQQQKSENNRYNGQCQMTGFIKKVVNPYVRFVI